MKPIEFRDAQWRHEDHWQFYDVEDRKMKHEALFSLDKIGAGPNEVVLPQYVF